MKRGFTLLELVVVIIILGILGTLGTQQYFRMIERARAAEAVYMLGVLRQSQLRYALENGVTANDPDDLDVEIQALKFFENIVCDDVVIIGNETSMIVSVQRKAGNPYNDRYYLNISAGGDINCSAATAGTCTKVGY